MNSQICTSFFYESNTLSIPDQVRMSSFIMNNCELRNIRTGNSNWKMDHG